MGQPFAIEIVMFNMYAHTCAWGTTQPTLPYRACFWYWWQLVGMGGLPRYYAVSQGILFMLRSIFKTHVTIEIFIYYT